MTRPPAPTSTFARAGFRGEVVDRAQALASADVLRDLEQVARAGDVLRENLYRVTARVVLPDLGSLLLKVHRSRSGLDGWLSFFRRGRARAEWDAARALLADRIAVPEPLAFGERRRFGLLVQSFFAARFVEGAIVLRVALEQTRGAERTELLRHSVHLVRDLHAAGFDHRDLHAGNVLVDSGADHGRRLVITDLHRHRRAGAVSERARARAVARWLHSLARHLDVEERGLWLAGYERDLGLASGFAARVAALEQRLEQRWRRSRKARCLVESSRYTRDVGGWRGARSRALSMERIEACVRAHDQALAAGDARVAKRGRKSLVTSHGDIVVKEIIAADRLARLRNAHWPTRHAAGYRNAHLLGVLGVGSAQPLAFLRRRGRILTLYEDLSAHPRLDHVVRERMARAPHASARALTLQLAAWLADLHARGIYHGDLKAVNVRVEQAAGNVRLRLIDTDRCRFVRGPVEERRRLKNLAQLAASIPVSATRSERLRFFRAYARGCPMGLSEREVASRVAALLAEKILVVHEPIE